MQKYRIVAEHHSNDPELSLSVRVGVFYTGEEERAAFAIVRDGHSKQEKFLKISNPTVEIPELIDSLQAALRDYRKLYHELND